MNTRLLTTLVTLILTTTALAAPLQEQWRTGGEDSDLFYGNILQVLPGENNETYLLDVQLLQIFIISETGEFLRTLAHQGDGPGEVNNANSMLTLENGAVGIAQVLPGKLVTVDRDNNPIDSIRITDPNAPDSGFVLLMNGQSHPDFFALLGMRWSMTESGRLIQNMFLRRYERDGTPGPDFHTKATTFDATHFVFGEQGFDFPWNRFGITPDGQVCFAPERNAYRIDVCNPDGTLHHTITRPYDSVKRNAEDTKQAELTTRAIGSHYGRELMGVTVADTEPDITALWIAPDGNLWVRTSRGDRKRDPGVLTTVDILDVKGNLLEQRAIIAPGDPAKDGIHFLPNNRVVVVTGAQEAYRRETGSTTDESAGGEERPLEVICYGMN